MGSNESADFHAATTSGSSYVRTRDLPKLLPLWPRELAATNLSDHARLIAKLRRALRAERKRGLGGHWSYDLARHAQLLHAYRAEIAAYRHAAALRQRNSSIGSQGRCR